MQPRSRKPRPFPTPGGSALACALALGVWLFTAAPPAAAQNNPSFQGVGDLAGGAHDSIARGVSADGAVVVGTGENATSPEGFVWTAGGGLVGIGVPGASTPFSQAVAVSADGATVAGTANNGSGGRAFRWTQGGGFSFLGTFSCFLCDPATTGDGISGDGSTVVGGGLEFPFLGSAHVNSARWPGFGSGIQDLGDLSGGGDAGVATDASFDGAVVVGETDSGAGPSGFYWTSGGGMQSLPGLPGALFTTGALAISADASTIVGHANASATGTNQPEPVRWTGGGYATVENLGALPGLASARGRAYDTTSDGAIVVGTTRDAAGKDTAFLWTAATGMLSLAELLEDQYGLDLGGFVLREARAISNVNPAGEFTVVGAATNPAGDPEGFVAFLSPTACNDGIDNDGDLLVDFGSDPECLGPGDRSETADCGDGLDNDGDGLTDTSDPGCRDSADLSEEADCSNGYDDDGDGLFDFPDDPGCRSATSETEAPACNDGIDNDSNGDTDTADAGCLAASDLSEAHDCEDGLDNDGDGFFDFVGGDTDCTAPQDPSEHPGCSDFVDNDGDGLVDHPDAYPMCTAPSDPIEDAECADGLDNDGDGDLDHPADLQCGGPLFVREAPVELAVGRLLVTDRLAGVVHVVDEISGVAQALSEGARLVSPQGVTSRVQGHVIAATPDGLFEIVGGSGEQLPRSGPLAGVDGLPVLSDPNGDLVVLDTAGIHRVAFDATGIGTTTTLLSVPVGAAQLQIFTGHTLALDGTDTAYTTGFGILGDGIFAADLTLGTVTAVTPGFQSHQWRGLALLDANTLAAVGRHLTLGEGVYTVDIATGAITLVNADPAWVALDGILAVGADDVYVVDSGTCAGESCTGGLVAHVAIASGVRTVLGATAFTGRLEIGRVAALPAGCDDRLDNDGDGVADFPADPGCSSPAASEPTQCDDELDNDGDGKIDWDGGLFGGTPDPQCSGIATKNREKPPRNRCGLGFELALPLAFVAAIRRRRAATRPA